MQRVPVKIFQWFFLQPARWWFVTWFLVKDWNSHQRYGKYRWTFSAIFQYLSHPSSFRFKCNFTNHGQKKTTFWSRKWRFGSYMFILQLVYDFPFPFSWFLGSQPYQFSGRSQLQKKTSFFGPPHGLRRCGDRFWAPNNTRTSQHAPRPQTNAMVAPGWNGCSQGCHQATPWGFKQHHLEGAMYI